MCCTNHGGIGAVAFSSSAQEKGLGTSINDKVIYVKLEMLYMTGILLFPKIFLLALTMAQY